MTEARQLIEQLQLIRHPEGGWYRETWRSPADSGERSAGTAIYFLLEQGQKSQWHQVDADELWLWHSGSRLRLRLSSLDGSDAQEIVLGPNILDGEEPQLLVPAGRWQSTDAVDGWALVSCIVVPAFEFAGFKLASPDLAAHLDQSVLASSLVRKQ